MVEIGGKPIIWHIMSHYAHFGHNEFVLALGYKAEVIKDYFLRLNALDSDLSINTSTGEIEFHNRSAPDWHVTLMDTGKDSLTGERIARLGSQLKGERFFLTYGDGLADVNIDKLLEHHISQGKLVTMTAVRPPARFGELRVGDDGNVQQFEEKNYLNQGWINGGFFVMEPEFLDLIPRKNVMLEREPLSAATESNQLGAFKHEGFWQCMDTRRDVDYLRELWDSETAPWASK